MKPVEKCATMKPGPDGGQIVSDRALSVAKNECSKYCTQQQQLQKKEEKFTGSNNNSASVIGGASKTEPRTGTEVAVAAEAPSRIKTTNLSPSSAAVGPNLAAIETTTKPPKTTTMVVVVEEGAGAASAATAVSQKGEKASKNHVDTATGSSAPKTSFSKNNDKCDTPAKDIIMSSSRADNGKRLIFLLSNIYPTYLPIVYFVSPRESNTRKGVGDILYDLAYQTLNGATVVVGPKHSPTFSHDARLF